MPSLGDDATREAAGMKATETITIQSPTETTNRYGDVDLDWDDPTETTIAAIVWPRTNEEDNDKRTATITGLSVVVPLGTAVTPVDRIVARGVTWEVDGEPADWTAPWKWEPGVQVDLRRVAG